MRNLNEIKNAMAIAEEIANMGNEQQAARILNGVGAELDNICTAIKTVQKALHIDLSENVADVLCWYDEIEQMLDEKGW